ncbi:heavy metal-binding protein HIP-like [Mya arenaria]|uniref:heavy metal-binding protein HIP-like n=1 Tax=Mya arenaria TaxID=6604 RepID=UPI0022DEDA87|nr:heavy metal-binding protein HIP-like [Mya arenaria]
MNACRRMTGLFQLLLLVSATVASEPSCPACSKYDYEEKILERLIRMEFAFEKLGEKVDLNLNNIKDEKERLHAVVDVMKDKQEQAERKLVSLMEEVERNQTSTLEKVVTDSKNTLDHMNAASNNNQDQIVTPLVYFNARSPQTSSLSEGEVIVYKTVNTNQGNGYSSTTGKFTAPARGFYLLLMHTCTPTNAHANLHIVKEGSVLMASIHYDKDQYTCSSSQAFVQLNVEESVWVKCSSGGSSVKLYDDSFLWTSFGGALIHN